MRFKIRPPARLQQIATIDDVEYRIIGRTKASGWRTVRDSDRSRLAHALLTGPSAVESVLLTLNTDPSLYCKVEYRLK